LIKVRKRGPDLRARGGTVNRAIRRISATAVRQKLGALLDDVHRRQRRIVIARSGKPIAALIDVRLFERLRKLDEEFEQLSGNLAKAFAGVSAAKGAALVDEAVKAAPQAAAH
jgi:prevent-host-death family protein